MRYGLYTLPNQPNNGIRRFCNFRITLIPIPGPLAQSVCPRCRYPTRRRVRYACQTNTVYRIPYRTLHCRNRKVPYPYSVVTRTRGTSRTTWKSIPVFISESPHTQAPRRTTSYALTSRALPVTPHPATHRPDRERDSSKFTVVSTASVESYRPMTTTGGTLSLRCISLRLRGFSRKADTNNSGQEIMLKTADNSHVILKGIPNRMVS